LGPRWRNVPAFNTASCAIGEGFTLAKANPHRKSYDCQN
jgi:hypothetical protein